MEHFHNLIGIHTYGIYIISFLLALTLLVFFNKKTRPEGEKASLIGLFLFLIFTTLTISWQQNVSSETKNSEINQLQYKIILLASKDSELQPLIKASMEDNHVTNKEFFDLFNSKNISMGIKTFNQFYTDEQLKELINSNVGN